MTTVNSQGPFNRENTLNNMVSTFVQIWNAALGTSRKLSFYRTFKENIGTEEYTPLFRSRKIASLRSSTLTLVTYPDEEP